VSRVQLSFNVTDLDAAVAFYSRLFGTAPAKLRPGYANFAIEDPPLKLVLNSPGNGPGGTINHLGVEVSSSEEVTSAGTRLAAKGLHTEPAPGTVCCYALQDKVWAHDPDGLAWEYYTVLQHVETP
jgi:catechol 2,3-dioxygenase-like lactoylglutathione lyase family enzyme